MKITRYIKLRTFAKSSLDLILERNENTLKGTKTILNPTEETTSQFLAEFKKQSDPLVSGGNPYV